MRLNQNTEIPMDMPKLQSPFKRQEINGEYVCIPEIEKEYEWVFSGQSIAVEKLDGTNVSIIVENNQVTAIYNRKNIIDFWKKGNKRFVEGVLEAVENEYINLARMEDGQYFGELIGPQVNANPYQLKKHLWIPLSILVERCRFKFWDDFVKELEGLDDSHVYEKVSNVFKSLWSLYKRKTGIKGDVDENTGFEGLAAEGIVFFRNAEMSSDISKKMAKLRRDMFDWYKGRRHGV